MGKGCDHPADYMSRHPLPVQNAENTRASKVAEEYVNFAALQATSKAKTLQELKRQYKMPLYTLVLQVCTTVSCHSMWPSKQYKLVSDELTLSPGDDIILRGTRIVIPTALQQRALQIAHENHQGIVKAKALL